MTPEQNCCFGLRNGKGNKKPLSYEKFGNIEFKERNFEIFEVALFVLDFFTPINS